MNLRVFFIYICKTAHFGWLRNILMLVHPASGDNIFYKVRDGNCIILIDSFGNEPKKVVRKNYILKKRKG